jgi:glycosyltransferase involved in cell wall biosynthesis
MPPLVSVVIPTYNRAHCINAAIRSVLEQTHPDVEALVIDDGSQDNTAEVVRAAFGTDERVRYVQQPNGGVSSARNHGFQLARGEFVALLDSDDSWLPWKLEAQLAVMNRFPNLVMTWTDMEATDPTGKMVAPRYLRRMYHAYEHFQKRPLFHQSMPLTEVIPGRAREVGDNRLFWGDIYSEMLMGNVVHTSTTLIRREYLERIGGFDESFRRAGEDYDFHVRTCREGPVALLDVPTIHYMLGLDDRITHPSNNLHFARGYLRTISRALERDGERINLPRVMIQSAQANAHAWIGTELYYQGERREAREHLWRSLRFRPAQARVWLLLTAALLPEPLVQAARWCYHKVRPRSQAAPAH